MKLIRAFSGLALAVVAGAGCRDKTDTSGTALAATPPVRPADADYRRDVSLPESPRVPKAPAKKAAVPPRAAPIVNTTPYPSTPALPAPGLEPLSMVVAAGARFDATIQDSLSSRINKSGERLTAVVSQNVMDGTGRVVIPAGSVIGLTIDKLEPGSDQVRPEGRLELVVNSVLIDGRTYPLAATLGPIPHTMKGRGITKDEAARVAAGAAVGAVIGQVIGKNTKGTVIGAAAGTVAGGAVAARYAYRDVVVAPGAPIVLTLSQALVVAR